MTTRSPMICSSCSCELHRGVCGALQLALRAELVFHPALSCSPIESLAPADQPCRPWHASDHADHAPHPANRPGLSLRREWSPNECIAGTCADKPMWGGCWGWEGTKARSAEPRRPHLLPATPIPGPQRREVTWVLQRSPALRPSPHPTPHPTPCVCSGAFSVNQLVPTNANTRNPSQEGECSDAQYDVAQIPPDVQAELRCIFYNPSGAAAAARGALCALRSLIRLNPTSRGQGRDGGALQPRLRLLQLRRPSGTAAAGRGKETRPAMPALDPCRPISLPAVQPAPA